MPAAKPKKAREPVITPCLPSRRLDILVVVTFALFSLACSILPSYPYVFPAGKTPRLAGPDAYYHLRHTEAVLRHYPVVERLDMLTNFPDGEIGLNQGFFDVTMATIVKITSIPAIYVLAWISPLCVVLIGIWCYLWISRAVSQKCGALFLLLYSLYPGALCVLAALGQGDHHAAEVVMMVAVTWALERLLRPATSWKLAPLAALPLIYFYLGWAGTSLHFLLVGVVFYARAWKPEGPELRSNLMRKGSLYGLTVLLAVKCIGMVAPWAVIWQTSEFIFIFSALCLTLGYPVLIFIARRPWRKPWLVAAGMALLPLLFAMAIPSTRTLILALFEERTLQVSEHTPVTAKLLGAWFGLLPIVALMAPIKMWRKGELWAGLVPLLYGGGLLFFWVQTRDFNYYPAPIIAAAGAYVFESLSLGPALYAALALMIAPPLLPNSGANHPWMSIAMIRETILYTDGLDEASNWLEETKGDIQPDSAEAYGLITPWDIGNILAQSSKTPVGFSETVSPELALMFYSDRPDEVYEKLRSKKRPFRYILLPARNLAEKFLGEMMATPLQMSEMYQNGPIVFWKDKQMGLISPSPRNTQCFINRLFWDLAQDLGHYRLVYESREQSIQCIKLLPETNNFEFASFPVTPQTLPIFQPLLDKPGLPMQTSRGIMIKARLAPEVRIFEAVPGVLITGKGVPNSQVLASVPVHSPATGHDWTPVYTTYTDSSGTFALRVPYPNDVPMSPAKGTVEVKGPYRVSVDGKVYDVKVKEVDVQRGGEVELPPATRASK